LRNNTPASAGVLFYFSKSCGSARTTRLMMDRVMHRAADRAMMVMPRRRPAVMNGMVNYGLRHGRHSEQRT